MPGRRLSDRVWFAAYYAIAFVGLGLLVSGQKPALFDESARALAGVWTQPALLLTETGLFPVYATIFGRAADRGDRRASLGCAPF